MNQRIGVIFQDLHSLGLLEGLRERLRCDAELVQPPAPIGRQSVATRKNLLLAWRSFSRQGANLVVRLTDSDAVPWQHVRREETNRSPEEAREIWVVGVAVENVEGWLLKCRPPHIEDFFGGEAPASQQDAPGWLKRRIGELSRECGKPPQEVVSDFVAGLPTEVFRQWLQSDESLKCFYSDCRAAATRVDCHTPNELDLQPS